MAGKEASWCILGPAEMPKRKSWTKGPVFVKRQTSAIMRSAGFVLWALLTSVFTACVPEGASRIDSPPNILFLFADDQRADTIAAWGNSDIQTPNLDRLVERGYSFRSNYNLGAGGGAVCVPSRAMVNSGRAYFRVPNDLQGVTLLGELLGQNGYTTFATGKWHNQRPSWLRSFQRGKNIFFGGMSDHTRVPLVDLSPEHALVNERVGDGFSSELFADAAVEFLTTYENEKPFYAYVAFTAPHDPRQPPMSYRQMYYDSRPPLPENFVPQHPFNIGDMTVRDENLAPWPRTPEIVGDQLAEYYGMITHLDEQIGHILEALEQSGHADNTVVVYAADHGLAIGSHGLLGKQSIYEHSQKCPLIIVGDGIPAGRSAEALTYLMDLFPTILGIAGVTPPGDTDGADLASIWRGEKEVVRETLGLAYMQVSRSIRDQRYKLIRYPQIDYTQLFDLVNDPHELNNLAEDPAHADRVNSMVVALGEWQERVGDDQPLTVENPEPMEIDLTGREREPDQWQPEWIVKKYF